MSDTKSNKVTLYGSAASTVTRPVLQLIAEQKLDVAFSEVNMMQGAHKKPEYLKINPQGKVPALVDGDFVLTESAAILRYLAEKYNATNVYPADLKKKARVNEALDWVNTELYVAWGYDFIYPQAFGSGKDITLGKKIARTKLQYLNDVILNKGNKYICGDEITIADYQAYAVVTIGDLVRQDFSPLKNVTAWLARMEALSSTASIYAVFKGWAGSYKDKNLNAINLSNLKLYYFGGRGRGELTRLLFAEGRIEYEDVRVKQDEWKDLKSTMPFGQMPVLEVDGVKIPESIAIERYASTVGHLYGSTLLDGAKIDMIVGAIADMYEPYSQAGKNEEKVKGLLETHFPTWFARLEKQLGDNKYFVGNDATYADIATYFVLTNLTAKHSDLLKNAPKLAALVERVAARPRIASWIEKRPKSDW